MENSDTYKLILKYIECAEYHCKILKEYSKVDILLIAKNQKLIPKEGNVEDVYYNFHGGGCYFEWDEGRIDVDFGPDGRCDGFDLWRLTDYFDATPDKSQFINLDENILKNQFEKLVKNRIIRKSNEFPGPHLFYLTNP